MGSKWLKASTVLAMAAVITTGCLAQENSNATPEGNGHGLENKVVVYSPHGKDIENEFEKLFEAKYPGVDVQILDMGSQMVLDRVRSEKNNPQGDIWWGAPSVMFEQAKREGLLQPYTPTYASALPEKFRSQDYSWTGTSQTPEVIMYNKDKVKPEEAPKDWDDLLDPKWKDKIIIRQPLASGTMRTIYTSMIDKEAKKNNNDVNKGYDWLKKLDANTKEYVSSPDILYTKMARGEGLVTVWNMPEAQMLISLKKYPLAYNIPTSGTPIITEGIAKIKGGKNPKAAEAFYEFVNSPEATKLLAEKFNRIPTRTDVTDVPAWMKETKITEMPLDYNYLQSNEKAWMEYWDKRIKSQNKDKK
ncbi:extracellular solute-binding protein [Risungbinella massiliensis]|uniref:extracellular solute-binding protein n=1 Tax=Risungbinella massiliensis TaxID=1329796 RepID=UPI000A76EF91|nr:extracellular solute-binding protein [Risungbinella massiliensis]